MLKKAEKAHILDMAEAAEFALRPDLKDLQFEIATDQTGEPCINFTLFVEVDKGFPVAGYDRVRHMEEAIRRIVEPEEYGLLSYFSLRGSKVEVPCSSR